MRFDRRTFLRGGMALGFGSWVWGRGGQPLAQSLAVTNAQRLALLIGGAWGGEGLKPLQGCDGDVAGIAEVLQTRYGLPASNIVSLTQQTGTFDTIAETFDTHLRQRAKKGDGVVVYFSGYGVYDPPAELPRYPSWEQALPYLGLLPSAGGDRPPYVSLATLISWLQSLKAKQITLILDCGFAQSAGTLQGNLRSRSAGRLDFRAANQFAPAQPPTKFSLGPVTLMSAAAPGQTAVEGDMGATTMGVFTYGLIQSLWEMADSPLMNGLWAHSRALLVPRLGTLQTPQWQSATNSPEFLSPLPSYPNGEGGILATPVGQSLQSHLAGLSPLVQENALLHSCYQATAIATEIPFLPPPLWQVSHRKGQRVSLVPLPLSNPDKASTKENEPRSLTEAIALGSLREIYRAVPKSLGLTVALGDDLERIERVDATSAFGAITNVEGIINAGDGRADCVFGKLDTHRYTLFTEGGELLQPLTKSESSGAIKTVVSSLESSLNRLLAVKWLTLLANPDSARLGVQVSVTQATSGDNPLPRSLYEWRSRRGLPPGGVGSPPNPLTSGDRVTSVPSAPPDFLPTVAANQTLQCHLENWGNDTLYGCLLGIDNRNLEVAGIFDPQLLLLNPQQRLTLPHPEAPLWSVSGDKGIAQWFLVLSRYPLTATLAAISQQVTSNNSPASSPTLALPPRLLVLKNLLPVVTALVTDLTGHPPAHVTVPEEVTLLDTADWLSLPIMYQVL
ncbi:MAG: caspase family protein [Synechocystis sp.]|nr:caspase family protein [Synechocystis sp.]